MTDTQPGPAPPYDPEDPDPQHAPPGVATDDPADTAPGEGVEEHPGELPAEIPDPAGLD